MTQNDINNTASIIDIDNIRIDGNTISSTDTNGNVILAPDGSGTVSVTTAPIVPTGDRADSLGSASNSWDNVYADGFTFDDGSNILPTYTESTSWTPVLAFGGASAGITYGAQSGNYMRIGKMVFVSFQITLTNKGSSSGNATITGLPFTAFARNFTLSSRVGVVTMTGSNTSVVWIVESSQIINRQQGSTAAGSAQLTNSEFANNSYVAATGFYFAA